MQVDTNARKTPHRKSYESHSSVKGMEAGSRLTMYAWLLNNSLLNYPTESSDEPYTVVLTAGLI